MDQLLQNLAAAGPLALVLALAVKTLWAANQGERDRHAAEEDRLREASRLERDRHAVEEEKLRDRYEAEIQKERAEIVETYKKFTRALRDEESQ